MKGKQMPGIMCRLSLWEPLLESVPDAYVGALLGAALKYAKSGEEPDLEAALDGSSKEAVRVAWGIVRADIDAQNARFQERMKRRQYAAEARRAKRDGAATGKEGDDE